MKQELEKLEIKLCNVFVYNLKQIPLDEVHDLLHKIIPLKEQQAKKEVFDDLKKLRIDVNDYNKLKKKHGVE